MAALPITLTVEQFQALDLTAKPHLEFWRGEVLKKPVSIFAHGLLVYLLGRILERYGLMTLPEIRVRLSSEADFVPDAIVVKEAPEGNYPTGSLQLAIEIRSPEQSLPWLTQKCRYYISNGADDAWIIDPDARTAWMFNEATPRGEWVSIEGSLRVGNSEVPLQGIFDDLDAALARLRPKQAQ